MNTTDIMKDPFFTPILFEIERRTLFLQCSYGQSLPTVH